VTPGARALSKLDTSLAPDFSNASGALIVVTELPMERRSCAPARTCHDNLVERNGTHREAEVCRHLRRQLSP
jgi:hypothetical protein